MAPGARVPGPGTWDGPESTLEQPSRHSGRSVEDRPPNPRGASIRRRRRATSSKESAMRPQNPAARHLVTLILAGSLALPEILGG